MPGYSQRECLLNVYATADLKLLHEAALPKYAFKHGTFSPDGRSLLLLDDTKSFTSSLAEKKVAEDEPPLKGTKAEWLADARLLTADENRLYVYSWPDRKELRTWHAGHGIEKLTATRDGTFAATFGTPDGRVFVWNVATGELVKEFAAHEYGVYAAAFSADGRHFITGGRDLKLKIWSRADWELVAATGFDEKSMAMIYASPLGPDFFTSHYGDSSAPDLTKQWNLEAMLARLPREPKPPTASSPEPPPPPLAELVAGTPPAADKDDLQLRRDLKRLSERRFTFEYVEKLLTVETPHNQANDRLLAELPVFTRPYLLKLSSNDGVTDAGYAHLAKQKNLVGLELGDYTPLSTAGLTKLKGLPLRTLIAKKYQLADDAAVAVLGEFTTLEKLHVTTTDERNDKLDLAPLAKLKRLRELQFGYFKTAGASLRHLADLTELEVLWFGGCDIRDEDLKHLGKLTKLRRLRLWSDELTGAGLADLVAAETLEVLDLSVCDGLNDAGAAPLAKFKKLRELDIGNSYITAKGLAAIAGLTNLEQLDVPARIDDAGMAHLAELTKVRKLSLWNKPITDAGLKHLAKWTELEEFSIRRCENVTGSGLAALAGAPKLKTLYLVELPSLTDAGLVGLESLTQLQELRLPPQITDAGLKHLAPLVNLKQLWFEKSKLTDAGIAQLAPLVGLETLSLEEAPITDASIAALAKLPKLGALYVSKTGITPDGVKRLKETAADKSLYVGR